MLTLMNTGESLDASDELQASTNDSGNSRVAYDFDAISQLPQYIAAFSKNGAQK